MLKAQAGVEAAFIFAMVVVFVVTVAVPGIREAELGTALSSARLAGVAWASQEQGRDFQALGFERVGTRCIELVPYYSGSQGDLNVTLLNGVRSTLSPSSGIVSDPLGCTEGLNYAYCMVCP
ncbi:MAG: hypothetical protein WC607_03920 [Candidatus Micrarchaeia archaeon]